MDPSRNWLQFYQADVFTSEPFGGNPLAVFPDAGELTDREFQQIAGEMNLSETVFVLPPKDPRAAAKIRIFTPSQEIPFAGHPVLGTFYVLGALKRLPLQEPVTKIFYECHLGVFPLELIILKGQIEQVVMSQPSPEFLEVVSQVEMIYELAKALGVQKSLITDSPFPVEVVSTGLPVLIVPIRTLTAMKSMQVNHSAIRDVCAVHTRMFAAPIGIPEDPATGSASGALGAYLVKNGVVEVGPTTEVVIEQGYEIDRPSRILVQVFSDDDMIQNIKVGGQVVMVAEGKMVY
jgi:trans-2,3-dihydro-3-hydroxyanthranilate isomerase